MHQCINVENGTLISFWHLVILMHVPITGFDTLTSLLVSIAQTVQLKSLPNIYFSPKALLPHNFNSLSSLSWRCFKGKFCFSKKVFCQKIIFFWAWRLCDQSETTICCQSRLWPAVKLSVCSKVGSKWVSTLLRWQRQSELATMGHHPREKTTKSEFIVGSITL